MHPAAMLTGGNNGAGHPGYTQAPAHAQAQAHVQSHGHTQDHSHSYNNAHTPDHTVYAEPAAYTATSADDQNKTSLPSISNLIGIADGDKTSAAQSASENPGPAAQQETQTHSQNVMPPEHMSAAQPFHPDYYRPAPPTPPMRVDSLTEVVQSPSTISSNSSISGPSYALGSAMNNIDPNQQRYHVPSSAMSKPPPGQHMGYSTSPYVMPSYMPSPSSVSAGYYSPDMMYPAGLYHQRPLPSNFPPTVIAAPMLPPGMVPSTGPWDHHYMTAAGHAPFPSVQDRYVCTTCKKAFSRPSSLKIHSHSHTGEKPFKCSQAGCGKAFSVRSNMKRHERGCHPSDELSPSTAYF
ncbi:hypothetical protein ANO11243_008620 [Dothideomycetidae sp. 11243]|nr:hypothetical protein ANO11243_008620 [fungal sp. No.11243]